MREVSLAHVGIRAIGLVLGLGCAVASAQVPDKTTEVVKAFSEICLGAEPHLASMEREALNRSGRLALDQKLPIPSGGSIFQKTWVIKSQEGEFALIGVAGKGVPIPTVTCSVGDTAGTGAAYEKALTAGSPLGMPTTHRNAPSGGEIVEWHPELAWGRADVMLIYELPGIGGVQAVLVFHPATED